MATLNFDPRWAEFLKAQGSGPQLTSPELGIFSGLVGEIQDPNSEKYRKYLGPGEYDKLFPELTKQRNANAEWQRSLYGTFQKQYGASAIAPSIGPATQITAPGTASIPMPAPPPASPQSEAPAPTAQFPAIAPTYNPSQIPGPDQLGFAAQNSVLANNSPRLGENWSSLFQNA